MGPLSVSPMGSPVSGSPLYNTKLLKWNFNSGLGASVVFFFFVLHVWKLICTILTAQVLNSLSTLYVFQAKCSMGPQGQYVDTVLTCQGNFFDPEFHHHLREFRAKLQELIVESKYKLRINPCSAGIDFSHQNLTSVDGRFWRLKSIPFSHQNLTSVDGRFWRLKSIPAL